MFIYSLCDVQLYEQNLPAILRIVIQRMEFSGTRKRFVSKLGNKI